VALPPAATDAQREAYRALAQAFPHFQPRTTQGT
jgi:curved DNA-binding protein